MSLSKQDIEKFQEKINKKISLINEKSQLSKDKKDYLMKLETEKIASDEKRNQLFNRLLLEETDEERKSVIMSLLDEKNVNTKNTLSSIIKTILLLIVNSYIVYFVISLLRASNKRISDLILGNSILEQLIIMTVCLAIVVFALILLVMGTHKVILKSKVFSLKIDYIIIAAFLGTASNYASKENVKTAFTGNVLSDSLDLLFYFSCCLFILFLITTFPRLEREWKRADQLALNETTPLLASDKPISTIDEDLFRRASFSKRLAEIVNGNYSSDSVTVGIYGEWGSGKSSIFNMVKNYLDETTIVFEFKPWYFGTDNQEIIRNFLIQLSNEFRKNKGYENDLVKDLLKYSSYLASISFRPPGTIFSFKDIIEKMNTNDNSISLNELRKKIEENLSSSNQRVVVFIDDIDRLDVTEIQVVFKLVRLIADFPNITYLLALDEKNVSIALGGIYTKQEEEVELIGRKYLEKFIQVPLYLPKSDENSIWKYCWNGINEVCMNHKLDFLMSEDDFFKNVINLKITPRNVKRYLNSLGFFAPMLKDEVNINDLIFINLVKILSPKLYEYIRSNPSSFLDEIRDTDHIDIKKIKDKFTEYAPVLIKLFPLTDKLFNGISGISKTEEQWRRDKRICSKYYFNQYFKYNMPDKQISQKELGNFLNTLGIENNLDNNYQQYVLLIGTHSMNDVNERLRTIIKNDYSDMHAMKKLFNVLLKQFSYMYGEERKISNSVHNLIIELSLVLEDNIFDTNLFNNETDLYISVSVSNNLVKKLADEVDLGRLYDQVAKRYMESSQEFFLERYESVEAQSLLESWQQYEHEVNIRNCISKWLKNRGTLEKFVSATINVSNRIVNDDEALLSEYISVIRYIKQSKLRVIDSIRFPKEYREIYSHEYYHDSERLKFLIFGYANNHVYKYVFDSLDALHKKMASNNNVEVTYKMYASAEELIKYGLPNKLVQIKEVFEKIKRIMRERNNGTNHKEKEIVVSKS